MKVRVLGAGVYGCHIASALIADGHDVVVHEIADHVFAGASGNMPARLHRGFHYPRSSLTRTACRAHGKVFEEVYGEFTTGVPINIYAIAKNDSLIDFGTYRQIMDAERECAVPIERPCEFGLNNVEGALLTGERHVLTDRLGASFAEGLAGHIEFGRKAGCVDDPEWNLTIDCTFCANDSEGVDRYEACLTCLLEGPTDTAVTIMDGPFPSLYPWDEANGLSSLTSAKWTPMAKVKNWNEAKAVFSRDLVAVHAKAMFEQMAYFYPRLQDEYRIVDRRLAIRAMPRSAADARLVDVIKIGHRAVRVRAGKLDAIFHAARVIGDMRPEFERA